MAISILTRAQGCVTILELHGDITLGPSVRAVQSKAKRLLSDPACAGIVMNLEDVKSIDSAGIGGLVTIHSGAVRRKVPIVLTSVSPRLMEIFEVTRVDALFDFADSEQAALSRLG